ncbi:LPS export ABC transporter permease LptF [Herminiimonas fonticola]|uniref:Lipopolysaccharide export system permease protein LptF n=1 Tax=Herminiimonas fonticola TaxID=303380 RepID=A0A4R6GHX6_9BURK|nr:LPS export ABC transporter permease LptF [Herminiimonas fonticola]RBA25478.1 putative permease [Herminiimonas fonticola]TDN94591.1 lipopolysaccharide export system permease protein [Herminiimonas fonticola]
MIFQRALRRDLLNTAGAVFTTLFTITITVMLIRILGQAAGGKVASADVIALIGFSALNYLPIILNLAGFMSVLLVVTRSYQDSEMVVWFASGLSLSRWIAPVLMFSLPIVFMTAMLSFFLTPWSNQQSAVYKERYANREDIARVSPGKFQESSSSNRVFFVEGVAGDATKVRNIFVSSVRNGKTSVVVAKEGTIEIDSAGDKFLVMHQGRRYDGVPTQSDFQLMEFDRYGVLVASKSTALVGDTSARALSTQELLGTRNNFNDGELLWRVSLPLMGILLMLLAIPLGFVNPRGGRSANLLIALFLFVFYSNMLSYAQATVVQSRSSFMLAWWPVHLVALLVVVIFFSWRLKVNSRYHPLVVWSMIKRAYFMRRAAP